MSYQFTEIVKPLVYTSAYRGDIKADVEQTISMLNQRLDSGWKIWSTHTMTVGDVGYIVYILRRFNKETENVSTKQVE